MIAMAPISKGCRVESAILHLRGAAAGGRMKQGVIMFRRRGILG